MGRQAKTSARAVSAPHVTSMADALFSRTKQRVLALLLGQPDREFTTTELITLAQSGSGAVQRELDRLVQSGLVSTTMTGRQKRFSANRDAPIFAELRAIVEKTAGVPAVLRACLIPLAGKVRAAVLYGSVAKATDRATSDIDVLLVADGLPLEEVFDALQPAEAQLGRRVSPTLYTSDEFQRRHKAQHGFLLKVLSGPHVVLMGTLDGLATG